MKFIVRIIALVLLIYESGYAQDKLTYSEPATFSLYGIFAIPDADFKQAIEKNIGIGLGLATLINLSGKEKAPSPFALGIDASYLSFGRDKIDKDEFQFILGDREEEIVGVKNYFGLGYGARLGWYT